MWAEGPSIRPAQGNALGNRVKDWPVGPTRAVRVGQFPQGVALGWVKRAPSGQLKCRQQKLPRPTGEGRLEGEGEKTILRLG